MTPRTLVLLISLLGVLVALTSSVYLAAAAFALTGVLVLLGDYPPRSERTRRLGPLR